MQHGEKSHSVLCSLPHCLDLYTAEQWLHTLWQVLLMPSPRQWPSDVWLDNKCHPSCLLLSSSYELLTCSIPDTSPHLRWRGISPPLTSWHLLYHTVLYGSYFANLHPVVSGILKTASDPFPESIINYVPHLSRPAINWYRRPTFTQSN